MDSFNDDSLSMTPIAKSNAANSPMRKSERMKTSTSLPGYKTLKSPIKLRDTQRVHLAAVIESCEKAQNQDYSTLDSTKIRSKRFRKKRRGKHSSRFV